MVTKAFTAIRGKRIRLTELDDFGRITPTSRQIATSGFVTLSLSPQVEEGDDIVVRNAAGAICVNESSNPSFTGFDVEIEFCDVNPSTLSIVTNSEEYEDYEGDASGFTVPEGEIAGRFALELWTGIAGVASADVDTEPSGYLLLPLVAQGTLGDLEVGGEDAITFSLSNSGTRGGNQWGTGPYDVLSDSGTPAPLPEALDPLDHLLMIETSIAPPPSDAQPELVSAAGGDPVGE